MQSVEERNSAFELLRIIAMMAIVICHFATHGGFDFDTTTVTVPKLWWYFMEMGGNFGVNIFVLISGYFLIVSKNRVFNFKRVLKFWGQVFFYSVSIYLVFCIVGICDFSLAEVIKTVFPITFEQWWFASTYFVLYLLHPFLNMFLSKLNKKTFQSLLTILIIIWCIIPTVTLSNFQSNSLLWFMTLYCVAAYIRLHGMNSHLTQKHYIYLWILFSALRYMSSVILIVIGTKIPYVVRGALAFYSQQSILTFLSALSLFMVFKDIKMGYHKWINLVASGTFGVYLIHDSNIIRPFLWHELFRNAQYQKTILLIPYSILVIVVVYSVCTVIDLGRQKLFEKPFMVLVNKYSDLWIKPFENILCFCKNIVFGISDPE